MSFAGGTVPILGLADVANIIPDATGSTNGRNGGGGRGATTTTGSLSQERRDG